MMIKNLLSKIPSILRRIGRLQCFETKAVVMGLIVVSHVGAAININ